MEDSQFFEPILAEENSNFKPLKTIPLFSFHLLISTAISLTGIILAICWPDEKRCQAYFIMLYLRVGFWFITFIFDHIVKYHHDILRLKGYHDFHRATAVHKSVPFYIISLWNTTLMGLQTLMQHYYSPNFEEHCVESIFSPIIYVTLFTGIENLILLGVHGSYIARVSRFNKAKQLPDALRGSYDLSGSIGVTQRGADLAELVEKQADLINFLKDHNLRLNQKLMHMNSQVRVVSIPATS